MLFMDGHVPYLRRRNTPAQLSALNRLFDATPHPSRAQRQTLANEVGMELKSVSNWFQNRRQISRKKSFSANENDMVPITHHRHKRPPFDRSQISLDRIATLSERSLTLRSNLQRFPLTPRKDSAHQKSRSSPSELWTHMLSSPVIPSFGPDPEEARLTALSLQAKTVCLEWACLKARQRKWIDEDTDGASTRPASGEFDEQGSKPGPVNLSPRSDVPRVLLSRPSLTLQFEDVEAAITLLGFKTRS